MNALGLPEHIIEATRDHDQPRPAVDVPRSLSDVVYVANLLAGGAEEWSRAGTLNPDERPELRNPDYLALMEEIEAEYQELLSTMG